MGYPAVPRCAVTSARRGRDRPRWPGDGGDWTEYSAFMDRAIADAAGLEIICHAGMNTPYGQHFASATPASRW